MDADAWHTVAQNAHDSVIPRYTWKRIVAEMFAQIVSLRGALPVVYVSGYAKTAQSQLSTHPGFLTKPFTPAALLAKVRERLNAEGLTPGEPRCP